MDVGIRELKAKLSEYLDRAARGETIRVTDRGKPKALLVPLYPEEALRRGVEEGWITPGNGERPRPVPRRHKGLRPSQEIIDEDRGD